MRLFPHVLLLALFAFGAGCRGSQPAPPAADEPAADVRDAPPAPEPAARPGVSVDRIVAAGAAGDAAAVLGRLQPPRRVTTEALANRHVPGQTDTLRTYHYDGLALTVYDVSASDKQLLYALQVTSDAYVPQRPHVLHVGMARAEVEAALGAPDERLEDGVTYQYALDGDGGAPGTLLLVRFDEGAAAALEWSFYVD